MSSSSSSLPCAVATFNGGNGNLETRLETRLVQLETDKDSLRLQVQEHRWEYLPFLGHISPFLRNPIGITLHLNCQKNHFQIIHLEQFISAQICHKEGKRRLSFILDFTFYWNVNTFNSHILNCITTKKADIFFIQFRI